MQVLNIFENETLTLLPEEVSIANKMKQSNPALPFEIIDENVLLFSPYIVGSIQINDRIINIAPRHSAFSMSSIFEMILFLNGVSINDSSTIGYDYTEHSGINFIPKYFCDICSKLVKFGLTGGYQKKYNISKFLNGDIVLEKFNKNIIITEGIHNIQQSYTLNIKENQIIKTALQKLMAIGSKELSFKISSLLREFDYVDIYTENIINYNPKVTQFYSCNPFYDAVLEIALIILKDLKLSFNNGRMQWFSFLQNSNDLFEKYVRKIVSQVVSLPVEKWNIPKQFASISYGNNIGFKSYAPDILIDYNSEKENCKVILDVKNKTFMPDQSNLSDIVATADIYQILFYCNKLSTNLAGLIYPANKNIDPITLTIDNKQDIRLMLLSIDMTLSHSKRLEKLKSDIQNSLLKYL